MFYNIVDVSYIVVFIVWIMLVVMEVDFGRYICLYIGYLDFVFVFVDIIVI